jgi:hypothetical protein
MCSAVLLVLLVWRGKRKLDAERNAAMERAQRVSRLYSALSQCNQAIVRSHTEAELFERICCDVVSYGGMQMAWIGLIDREHDRITVAASYGGGDTSAPQRRHHRLLRALL